MHRQNRELLFKYHGIPDDTVRDPLSIKKLYLQGISISHFKKRFAECDFHRPVVLYQELLT